MKKYYEENYGVRDENGHWKPPYPVTYSAFFQEKLSLKVLLKYLLGWGGYLYPRHLFYVLLSIGTWFLLKEDIQNFSGFTFEFVGLMLLRNLIMIWIIYGGYHLLLYILKVEGTKKKYHPEWLSKDHKKYIFGRQVYDNIFLTSVVGLIVWTAYELWYIYLYSKGSLLVITFQSNPIWFVVFFLLIPLIRETHFYVVHKFLHTPYMMKKVHMVHHRNPNPGPWSGMAMHPIETIIYFSVVLLNFVVPSHPIHFFYTAQLTGLTPAQGHTGFEAPLLNGWLPSGDYFHYLHHKHLACNFGAGTIPWDKWFGIFYDGEGEFKFQKVKFFGGKQEIK